MRFPPRLGEPSRRNRVLEARPNRFGVGVGELDADDGAQRYGGEVGWRGVRPFGVPHVDDEAAGVAVGVLTCRSQCRPASGKW
jgi:hypothetical protein